MLDVNPLIRTSNPDMIELTFPTSPSCDDSSSTVSSLSEESPLCHASQECEQREGEFPGPSRDIIGNACNLTTGRDSFSAAHDTQLPSDDIVSGRPRRQHRRVVSATFSIGTIVGESSWTQSEPSAISSSLSNSVPITEYERLSLQKHRIRAYYKLNALVAPGQKRNHVKNDIKYAWDCVSRPILKLTKMGKTVDLKRASGSLV